jgi:hypothetical protein
MAGFIEPQIESGSNPRGLPGKTNQLVDGGANSWLVGVI